MEFESVTFVPYHSPLTPLSLPCHSLVTPLSLPFHSPFTSLSLLKNIPQLLFYLLEFVLHRYYQSLYLHVVGLGTGGVDLAAHFLCYEAQFLAAALFVLHHVAEVVDVFLQTDFLLGDVEFLQIVDEFLLKAVLVDLLYCCVAKHRAHTLFGCGDAFGLVLGYFVKILLYQVYVFGKVGLEDFAFVQACAVEVADGIAHFGGKAVPFLFAERRFLVGSPHFGLAEDDVQKLPDTKDLRESMNAEKAQDMNEYAEQLLRSTLDYLSTNDKDAQELSSDTYVGYSSTSAGHEAVKAILLDYEVEKGDIDKLLNGKGLKSKRQFENMKEDLASALDIIIKETPEQETDKDTVPSEPENNQDDFTSNDDMTID